MRKIIYIFLIFISWAVFKTDSVNDIQIEQVTMDTYKDPSPVLYLDTAFNIYAEEIRMLNQPLDGVIAHYTTFIDNLVIDRFDHKPPESIWAQSGMKRK